jgi:hypothetical protein
MARKTRPVKRTSPEPPSPERDFRAVRARLRKLEARFNPGGANLHFESLARGDDELLPALLALCQDGLELVRTHHAYFSKHALYDDGMFWYDLFLMVSAASLKVAQDTAEAYIPKAVVRDLVTCLLAINRYTAANGGDITKRNSEALGNTLVVFYTEDLVQRVRKRAGTAPVALRECLNWTLKQVEAVRDKGQKKTAAKPQP